MPKKCIKFIPEYLIPSLDNKRFGERLKWIDKSAKMFEIDWSHKAAPHWSEQEAQVFVEWDKHKGHFNPENKLYYSQSKQRFRALLYKLTKEGQLKEMPSKKKFKKVFCIGQKKNRKKKRDIDAEYDSSNEEETSELEYEEPGALICRKISEDGAVNVLDDHSYSASDNFSGFLLCNAENEQAILSDDTWVPTSSSDQKRVLVERNYENITILMPASIPNLYTENYSLFEDWKDVPDNSTLSLPAGKLPTDCYHHPANQNISIPEIMFFDDVNSSQPNTQYLESWLNGLYEERP